MSNKMLEDFRRQQAEEEFFHQAADEIKKKEDELFWEAQSLPDPSPEVLKRMRGHLQQNMKRAARNRGHQRLIRRLTHIAACAAAIVCVLSAGTYLGVDAARTAVNNFVLDFFDGNATMQTEEFVEGISGVLMPKNWDGPFALMWTPERFSSVESIKTDGCWILIYDDETSEKDLTIYVWNEDSAPSVDTQEMELISQMEIQGSQAELYYKPSADIFMLLWVHEDYLVQIGGDATQDEMTKIAKKILF